MAIRSHPLISIDNEKATLGVQVENLHLILRSKRQIAFCARNVNRRAKIAVGCI